MSNCLHHNTLGCIGLCPGQCCLHLYFGNVGLRLLPHELQQWQQLVAELYQHHAIQVTDPAMRCLSLPGPVAEQVFLFSLEELYLLHDLLVSAALLLEVKNILAQASRDASQP